MSLHDLLSLPHLPTRHTRRKELLVDHLTSRVVTFAKCLPKETMDKTIAKEIKEAMQKERDYKRAKRATNTLTMVKCAIQRTIEKHVRAQFNSIWFVIIIFGKHVIFFLRILGKPPRTSNRI
jgi:hypothetical protein